LSRLNPSESSSSFIRLLTTDGVVRSSAAALVKLRRCATLTNVLSLFRSLNTAVKGISLSLAADPGSPESGSDDGRQAAGHDAA
jgi:hypothetical protein